MKTAYIIAIALAMAGWLWLIASVLEMAIF
jgi:hypothetical protein